MPFHTRGGHDGGATVVFDLATHEQVAQLSNVEDDALYPASGESVAVDGDIVFVGATYRGL